MRIRFTTADELAAFSFQSLVPSEAGSGVYEHPPHRSINCALIQIDW